MLTQMLIVIAAVGLIWGWVRLRHFILAHDQDKRKYYRAYLVGYDEADWGAGERGTNLDPDPDREPDRAPAVRSARASSTDQESVEDWPTELEPQILPSDRSMAERLVAHKSPNDDYSVPLFPQRGGLWKT